MSNPNRSFYVREITRKIEEQINSVRRELSNLLSIGIIASDSSNNRLYYEVNQKFEHYQALASIFGEQKLPVAKATESKAKKAPASKAQQPKVGDEERSLGNVELLVLGGIFTRDKRSPVDVLIVGNVTPNALDHYIADLEKTAGAEISYATFTLEELRYRQQIKDKFITMMLSSKLTIKVDRHGILSGAEDK